MLFEFYFLFAGLCVGSFLHTSALRLLNGKSLFNRSSCDECGKTISVLGLIPVLGFIILKGKCVNCGYKIPILYPLTELMTGICFWLIYKKLGTGPELFFMFAIWSGLIMISIADSLSFLILWQPVVVIFLVRSAMLYFAGSQEILDSVIGLLAGAGFFHFVSYFYLVIRGKVGLGEGDTTVIGLIGFILTWQALLPVILFASVSGIFYLLVARFGKGESLRSQFPFAPALCLGAFIHFEFPWLFNFIRNSVVSLY